jgi:hypothetical protein
MVDPYSSLGPKSGLSKCYFVPNARPRMPSLVMHPFSWIVRVLGIVGANRLCPAGA